MRLSTWSLMGVLLLTACSGYAPPAQISGMTQTQLVAQMGQPDTVRQTASGTRLEFPRGPMGHHTWFVDVDPNGKIIKTEPYHLIFSIWATTQHYADFDVQVRDLKYRMSPVATTTGAIRLEDQKAGAVWLQILNKSMLMNHKLGQRLADECMGVEQQAINETLKKNPARSVLEPALPTDAK